jgi:hypothetical protein
LEEVDKLYNLIPLIVVEAVGKQVVLAAVVVSSAKLADKALDRLLKLKAAL